MPSADDSAALNNFLDSVRTVLAERYGPQVGRRADRDRLAELATSFDDQVRPRLLEVYEGLDDNECLDAGIRDQQLESKVALVIAAVEPPPRERIVASRRGVEPISEPLPPLKKSALRRFLKRAKILAGSLRKLVPGAEALLELLDFADSVLDR
jgi:hypothetical protein